ncbi:hypothetical protein LBE40_04840 [Bartonella taylorii]|uniref:Uncharacterized protein n=1 Tax=Bartonella taylorii 8TBB TaxID=1094560 RepID=A0A9P2RYL4_BARTA|nr:hypothetical protein [Bartonella taylorii]EJF92238.1 hypothetical protein ME9_01641 [Bartonella taylorii 8TBB]USP00643.1 hypothetical protein LBE40_04840 [Bartonella taylorii]
MVRTDNEADVYTIVYAFLLDFSSIILIKKLKNCYAISDFFCDADDMVHFVAHFEGA